MATSGTPSSGEGELHLASEEAGPSHTILHVRGEVDVYTSPALREELYRMIDAGTRRVTLDLSEMDFIDSSGLGVFVGALKRVREQSGTLELEGLQPSTRKVFDITGLTQVFTVLD